MIINIEVFQVGQMKSNCIVASDNNKALIIDPGDDAEFLIDKINNLDVEPVCVIATHGHFDHNMGSLEIQTAYKIPFYINEKDDFLIKKISSSAKYYLNINNVFPPKNISFIKEGKKFNLGKGFFEVMEIPGHTPGGIALYNPFEKILISGDVIFKDGSIGRYDFSYSSKKDLDASFKKIFSLPEETIIYPGHGDETSIIKEKYYHS